LSLDGFLEARAFLVVRKTRENIPEPPSKEISRSSKTQFRLSRNQSNGLTPDEYFKALFFGLARSEDRFIKRREPYVEAQIDAIVAVIIEVEAQIDAYRRGNNWEGKDRFTITSLKLPLNVEVSGFS